MLSLPQPLLSLAHARPQHEVLTTADSAFTAAQLVAAVAARAGALAALGLTAADTVVLCGPASADWVVSLHAVAWLGAAALPLSPSLTEAEMQQALLVGRPQAALSHGVLPAGQRRALAALGEERLWAAAGLPTAAGAAERFWPLEEVRLRLLTSGTTAAPRLVALTTAQLLFSSYGACTRLGHLPNDRWLLCLPLHHVGGLSVLYRAAWQGTQVDLAVPFDAAQAARALDAGRVNLTALVPTMLQAILDARPAKPFPGALRAILLGGAAADATLLARCRGLRVPLVVSWGMTETAALIAAEYAGASQYQVGACGPPLPFARVDAVAGALRIRGPVAVAGEVQSEDLGECDPTGPIWVQGRRDDLVISGGENIVPQEVEAVLQSHPEVAEAAVVGVPSAHWGQRPVAFLVLRSAGTAVPPEMAAWCRQYLAGFKVPDRFIVCLVLPRNALGKLQRPALRALALTETS